MAKRRLGGSTPPNSSAPGAEAVRRRKGAGSHDSLLVRRVVCKIDAVVAARGSSSI